MSTISELEQMKDFFQHCVDLSDCRIAELQSNKLIDSGLIDRIDAVLDDTSEEDPEGLINALKLRVSAYWGNPIIIHYHNHNKQSCRMCATLREAVVCERSTNADDIPDNIYIPPVHIDYKPKFERL